MTLKTGPRREAILQQLLDTEEPISAKVFAIDHHVSRQVIVQDIAVLKASGNDIISTNRGYFINRLKTCTREVWVKHAEDRVEEELTLIVDYGGAVKNVSISHAIYGRISAELKISSRADVLKYMEKLKGSSSSLLGNATLGYHYHLLEAESEETLDVIEEKLAEMGFLVCDN